jgi:hypothetical protein
MDDFRKPIRQLRSALLARTALADLDESSEPRVARGLDWLASRQAPSGGFGSGGAAETAQSVLALLAWRPAWRVSESHALACAYLEDRIATGEALETLWDEAVVLRVLIGSDDAAVRGRALERALALIARATVADPPHHVAQALSLAHEAGLPTDDLEEVLSAIDIESVGGNA